MKGKRIFYCELSYLFGMLILAFGNAFMEKADLGMSMVVAPAYILHLVVSKYLPFFTFGMAGYVFQAVLLCVLALVMKKVKKSYFLSFVTAFLYGLLLDAVMSIVALFTLEGFAWQCVFFALGLVLSSIGVSLLLHSYFPPEAYEIVVKEVAQKYNVSIGKTKTIYDCCSCALGIILSLCFFGGFVGVKYGTVICALVNGFLIGNIGKFLEKNFDFKDALPLRDKIDS